MYVSDGFPSLHTSLLSQLRTSVITRVLASHSQGTCVAFSRFQGIFQMSPHLPLRYQH